MKTFLLGTLLISGIFTGFSTPDVKPDIPVVMNETVYSPNSSVYEWRYKTVNNQLYKRLFDVTRNKWIGDWILVS